MTKLLVPASPCESCPYRRDVPSGVWHESEYEKLRGYDDPQTAFATFLCHHSTTLDRDAVCRGWLTVHRESVAARLAEATDQVTAEERYAECKAPLFATGNEAADAGIAGIKRPNKRAVKQTRRLAAKLFRKNRRARRKSS